jgi:hypothetical protein
MLTRTTIIPLLLTAAGCSEAESLDHVDKPIVIVAAPREAPQLPISPVSVTGLSDRTLVGTNDAYMPGETSVPNLPPAAAIPPYRISEDNRKAQRTIQSDIERMKAAGIGA